MEAFVTGTGICLPNSPVHNDEMEQVLGFIGGRRSRTREVVLRQNGIRTRYYALDPATGRQTHTNARLTANAIRDLTARSGRTLDDIDCLACGTASPDQWIPNHAVMVQGDLGCRPCEAVATAGVCVSGMTALKYAAMSVASGLSRCGVATGSELASTVFRKAHFQHGENEPTSGREAAPIVATDQDFLRWMLSDGAGAVLIETAPRRGGVSLRVDWLDIVACAGQLETCMYWGAVKRPDGGVVGWRELEEGGSDGGRSPSNVSQDIKLLQREIGRRSVNAVLPGIIARHRLAADDIDWLLPHYSSEHFRQEFHDRLVEVGFPLPFERWFTNLTTKGNTGSASLYIMLDELLSSGRVRPGHRILGVVPESARFTVAYLHLTAVAS